MAEVFSQGMEYLSLCYGEADANLEKLKLLDSLCVYVEQAAYASFEQQLYGIPAGELTAERIDALYNQICANYGLNNQMSYVLITHFYTNPMYVISYVLSNDAALQIYQMEKAEKGAGLACYTGQLAGTESDFLTFLQYAGLESPFTPGRIGKVRQTLQTVLQN